MAKDRLEVMVEMLDWCDENDASFEMLIDHAMSNKVWSSILHNRKNIAILASHCALLQGIPFDSNYEIFSVIDQDDYQYFLKKGYEIIPDDIDSYHFQKLN